MPVEYGTCPSCGGSYEEHHVEVRIQAGEEPVIVEDVAQGRCYSCGSTVYKLDLLTRLESILRRSATDSRINVPTEALAQASARRATG